MCVGGCCGRRFVKMADYTKGWSADLDSSHASAPSSAFSFGGMGKNAGTKGGKEKMDSGPSTFMRWCCPLCTIMKYDPTMASFCSVLAFGCCYTGMCWDPPPASKKKSKSRGVQRMER